MKKWLNYLIPAALLAAFVLKLFPLLGVVVVLRRGRFAAVRSLLIALGFALLYLGLTYDDLALIRAGTTKRAGG